MNDKFIAAKAFVVCFIIYIMTRKLIVKWQKMINADYSVKNIHTQ